MAVEVAMVGRKLRAMPEAIADPSEATAEPVFRPAPHRVVLRPFVPAEDDQKSSEPPRRERIADRVARLSTAELERELDRVMHSLRGRHRDVRGVLRRRFAEMATPAIRARIGDEASRLLCGAYFVEEYSFEAAALFNPSVTIHPDQRQLPAGATRLLFSLRAIGEGHVSSIVFRSAELGRDGHLLLHPASRWAVSPAIVDRCQAEGGERVHLSYRGCKDLSEVVIFPITYQQRHGVEDLRLVRFTEEDGGQTYLGTYTAFSGESVRQEMLRTNDFISFDLHPLTGSLAATKGMALFPRRIAGRYAMLGRFDHENIWLMRSDDLDCWEEGAIVVRPRFPWEFVQLGICSPPIEIDEGWLCITHGVGAVRNYCLGAILLDKVDPSKLLARSTEPLLRPASSERDGYVPNVVYSCGAFVTDGRLLLPYGVADSHATWATLSLDAVLATLA